MKNSNLIVQFISLALWVFAFAGLEVNPDDLASQGYAALVTKNWPLITLIAVNLGNSIWHWTQTWQTNKPNFLLFLRSHNWWASALNIGFAYAAMHGIVVPADAAQNIINFAFTGDWWNLAGYVLPNVLAPIVSALTKKPVEAQKAILARLGK